MKNSIMKICPHCKIEKPVSDFHRHGKYLNSWCKPCSIKDTVERQKRNPEQKKERAKRHYDKHKEAIKNKVYEWKRNNAERTKEYLREWRKKHPRYGVEKVKEWARKNSLKVAIKSQKRRALKAAAEGSYTESEFVKLCEKYENRCLCCREQNKLTADHVIPLSKGGSNWIANIQPLCGICNSSKGTKIIDFRKMW